MRGWRLRGAFVLLFGAVIITSMLPVLAEFGPSNTSPDVSNSSFLSSTNIDPLVPYPYQVSASNYTNGYGNCRNQTMIKGLYSSGITLPKLVDSISYNNMASNTGAWIQDLTSSGGSLRLREAWTYPIGGPKTDFAYSMRATEDGGYILVGFTDTDESRDIFLVKTTSNGTITWEKTFGEKCVECGWDVRQTRDHGYIIAGLATGFNNTICNPDDICFCFYDDAILIKTDSEGNIEWERTFGTEHEEDEFFSVSQTEDGGYIATGRTYSYGAEGGDLWLLKTDSLGKELWNTTYGSDGFESGQSVEITRDGGYIISGVTTSFGGYKAMLLKTNALGDVVGGRNWQKIFEGLDCGYGMSALEDKDGNYVLVGETRTSDAMDASFIKIDYLGNTIFTKRYGGKSNDAGRDVKQTKDGGYIVAGYSESFGEGESDGWVIKIDSEGNEIWNSTLGSTGVDVFWSVEEVHDSYVFAGTSKSPSADPLGDFWLVKAKCQFNPIILVHGFFSTPDKCWERMKSRLEADGFDVYPLDYAPGMRGFNTMGDIKGYAEKLSQNVTEVKKMTGSQKVDIVAHSMGGLISRWYMEKTDGARNVDRLIMIGTPNSGSELLYPLKFPQFQPTLFGLIYSLWHNTNPGIALFQMMPGSDFLGSLGYNNKSKYYIITGDQPNHPFLKISGWYLKGFSPRCTNDGVVRYLSAALDGNLPSSYHVDHLEEPDADYVYSEVLSILKAQYNRPTSTPKVYSEIQEAPVQTLPSIVDLINASESKYYDINVDPSQEAQFSLIWLNGSLSLSLITPSGLEINQSATNSTANVTSYVDIDPNIKGYSITNPNPGVWTAKVAGLNVSSEGENFALLTMIKTNLTMETSPSKYYGKPHEAMEIKAKLTNGSLPITGANMVARIGKPDGLIENISLLDDGLHNDSQADDGLYANSFENTSLSGAYVIEVYSNGLIGNREFTRQCAFVVWAGLHPDLNIASSDISFSNSTPVSGEQIIINAVLHNIGDVKANNATILFYDDLPAKGRLIGNDTISIEAGETSIASVSWKALGGVHSIYAEISPFNEFLEKDYLNNNASQRIFVRPFCGSTGEWRRTFGKPESIYVASDDGYSVQQTNDGGYVVAGSTESYGEGSDYWDSTDFWAIKTNHYGIEEWNRTFGDDGYDSAYSINQTSDGGYIVAGETCSRSTGNHDYTNIRVVKLDSYGDEEWTKILGSTCSDIGYSVKQTTDGGYIIAGATTPSCYNNFKPLLIKLSSDGTVIWEKVIPEYYIDIGTDNTISVHQTADGGYILTGESYSSGATYGDLLLIKTDDNGNMTWSKTFGYEYGDQGMSIKGTSDGGYIIAGTTYSYGASGNNYEGDMWLLKTDSNGLEQWNKSFGGANHEQGYSAQQTSDGGYVIAGWTSSYTNGETDYSNGWIVKTDPQGVEQWNKSIGGLGVDEYRSLQQTCDGGYILAGIAYPDHNSESDFLLEKVSASFHLYYPDFTDTANTDSWRSWLVMQNSASSVANITLDIRSRTGEVLFSGSQIIPSHGVSALRPRNLVGEDCAGSVVVTSDQPIIGTCQITRNSNKMCMSYNAFTRGYTKIYYPDFTDTLNPDSWRSWLVIQNPEALPANLGLELRSRSGDLLYSGQKIIRPHETVALRPRDMVGGECTGSVTITSDMPIVGTCQITRNNNLMCMSYNALDHVSGELYYPDFTDTANPNSWRSWIVLHNYGYMDEYITIEIRSRDGNTIYSGENFIPARGVKALRLRDLVGSDCSGSITVTSWHSSIVGTCQISRNDNSMCMSYSAIDHGNKRLYYPDFTDTTDPNSWRSWIVLQNPASSPANLTLEMRSRAGDLLYSGDQIIPAHGVSAIRPRNLVGSNCAGSVVVNSDQPIIGTCQIIRNNNLMCMSYTAN